MLPLWVGTLPLKSVGRAVGYLCIASVQYTIPPICYVPSTVYTTVGPKKKCEVGIAVMNFIKPCHHVMKFVDRAVLIEPVDLQLFVIFVRGTLEASFSRSFDVLLCYNSSQCFVSNGWGRKLKFER